MCISILLHRALLSFFSETKNYILHTIFFYYIYALKNENLKKKVSKKKIYIFRKKLKNNLNINIYVNKLSTNLSIKLKNGSKIRKKVPFFFAKFATIIRVINLITLNISLQRNMSIKCQ